MPKNGLPLLAHALFKRIDHAGNFVEPTTAIGKGADAGQHHAIGTRDRGRIVGYDNRLVVAALASRAFESLRSRMQIAGAIVNNGDAHR